MEDYGWTLEMYTLQRRDTVSGEQNMIARVADLIEDSEIYVRTAECLAVGAEVYAVSAGALSQARWERRILIYVINTISC